LWGGLDHISGAEALARPEIGLGRHRPHIGKEVIGSEAASDYLIVSPVYA
jgi:hypothetical protein